VNKIYIVRLCEPERQECRDVIKHLKGSSLKVRRAQMLLKADADGPNWTDSQIADAFDCRRQTVENLRKRVVLDSFEAALCGVARKDPSRKPLLDGEQEAKLIALRLGQPPKGYGKWTLRLLADEMVALEITESISHETVRQTLKKMA